MSGPGGNKRNMSARNPSASQPSDSDSESPARKIANENHFNENILPTPAPTAVAMNIDIPSQIPVPMALSFSGRNPFGEDEDETRPETSDPSISFDTVGGLESQISYIQKNILYPTEYPEDFDDWGMEPLKGVIFHGPPGTGKTLLSKALATELSKCGKKVNFFMRKGSDCFSKWIGDSEKTIRELFRVAKAMQPSIIFFDELDGLSPPRNSGGHHFYTSIVTCLLGEMDSLKRGEVFVIGATNRLDAIDPALKRPGRFDKDLVFLPPNESGRVQMLNIFLNKWKNHKPSHAEIVDLAKRTVGFTGADLEQLCREAFHCALERQMPDLGKPGTDHRLRDLIVTEADWKMALSKQSKSNSNVFGNAIFSGEMVVPAIRPLIHGIVSEVASHLKQFIHSETSSSDPICDGTGIKSFLVSGETTATVDVVDAFIFPSIMTTFDSEKTPGFLLNELTLQTTSLLTVMDQVNNCRKSCFLFISKIDKLWSDMTTTARNIFKNQIEMTRGTNIVIIASSSCTLKIFPEELRSLFHGMNRNYEMRKPNPEERHEFFHSIFNPESKFMQEFLNRINAENSENNNNTTSAETKLKELGDRAERITEGDEIRKILTLQGELSQVCVKYSGNNSNAEALLDDFKDVLDAYEENKFDN